jgi:hypothetical protein
MLNNYDLTEIADSLDLPLNLVSMRNEIAKRLKNGDYIINLQSSDEGSGTHWLNLVIRDKDALIFDSFGCIPATEIIDAVKKTNYIYTLTIGLSKI